VVISVLRRYSYKHPTVLTITLKSNTHHQHYPQGIVSSHCSSNQPKLPSHLATRSKRHINTPASDTETHARHQAQDLGRGLPPPSPRSCLQQGQAPPCRQLPQLHATVRCDGDLVRHLFTAGHTGGAQPIVALLWRPQKLKTSSWTACS
jgi:predicted component of type VI protein secretion system